mgnify:CR=1 FL=1
MSALRLRLECTGAVQGIGFRPYVKRLADRLGLAGFVANRDSRVLIEIEGAAAAVADFEAALRGGSPAGTALVFATIEALPARRENGFAIAPSIDGAASPLPRTPDHALCAECRRELFTPGTRRHRYPFIACARCGPRYAITMALPFDRERTSYRAFPPCADCAREYADPRDRRFHAETVSCPACGPRLAWLEPTGVPAPRGDPLGAAIAALGDGALGAVRGTSGFHLLARADDPRAIARLRALKRRPRKPCGLLVASIAQLRSFAAVSALEAALLASPAAPLVLVAKCAAPAWAEAVAPGNPRLAVMLPANGVHALLTETLPAPLVATSANRAGEAIIADTAEAVAAFAGAVDFFLVHDLAIVEPQDDAIVQIAAGRPMLLRRGRGYAPALEHFAEAAPRRLVASGAQLKNGCGVLEGRTALLSQYQGDLDGLGSAARQTARVARYARGDALVLKEAHPDVGWDAIGAADWLPVPHHRAHARAAAVEHGLVRPHLAVVWDGLGLGEDGGWWGGEFFRAAGPELERIATLRPLRLPGATAAIRHPDRIALALLWEAAGEAGTAWHRARFGTRRFGERDYANLARLLADGRHAPWSHSVGRLFDGLASLLDIAHENGFEGEAAMALQFAAEASPAAAELALPWQDDGALRRLDWRPMVAAIMDAEAASPAAFARGMHLALARAIVDIARHARLETITLGGGCFQNRLLVELVVEQCRVHGLECLWPQRHPPNDGGIALGQLALGLDLLRAEEKRGR